MTQEQHTASLRGQLLQQNYETVLSGLASAAAQLEEKVAEITALKARVAELELAMDKAPVAAQADLKAANPAPALE